MRIDQIDLYNFRGFKRLHLNLEGQSTVLFGINGVGKSSILRAVDLVYANIIGEILKSRKKLAELSDEDIHDSQPSCKAELTFSLSDGRKIKYGRGITSEGKKQYNKLTLTEIVSYFVSEYIGTEVVDEQGEPYVKRIDVAMPIFVSYGVNRSIHDYIIPEIKVNYSKLTAFDNAIESRIDFRGFFSWFKQQEDLENELIANRVLTKGKRLPSLDAARTAMLAMFPEFTKVRFDRIKNTLIFEKNKEQLVISQLSDGEKCTIALFGDIARRMSIAGGSSDETPLKGEGVVLIDEVDLHLHPLWQRQIVGLLKKTFPNIQFIISTHSPQVLGGVDKDFYIVSLKSADGEIVAENIGSLYGWDTNIILEEAMGTSSVNTEVLSHIKKMYSAFEDGEIDEAEKEADFIDMLTNYHNDHTAGMRVRISRKRRGAARETNS